MMLVHLGVSAMLAWVVTFAAAQTKLRGVPKTGETGDSDGIATVPDDDFAVLLARGSVEVHIGSSEQANERCVDYPTPVSCDAEAGNPGKRVNDLDQDYGDQFTITVKDGGKHICARRTDKKDGWGQLLTISCTDMAPKDKDDKCMCLTTAEGDCSCKGCTEHAQKQTCGELLGPCTCHRSKEAICDCSGYCHTQRHRQDACENEPGCVWSGHWCEAEIGMMWQ